MGARGRPRGPGGAGRGRMGKKKREAAPAPRPRQPPPPPAAVFASGLRTLLDPRAVAERAWPIHFSRKPEGRRPRPRLLPPAPERTCCPGPAAASGAGSRGPQPGAEPGACGGPSARASFVRSAPAGRGPGGGARGAGRAGKPAPARRPGRGNFHSRRRLVTPRGAAAESARGLSSAQRVAAREPRGAHRPSASPTDVPSDAAGAPALIPFDYRAFFFEKLLLAGEGNAIRIVRTLFFGAFGTWWWCVCEQFVCA